MKLSPLAVSPSVCGMVNGLGLMILWQKEGREDICSLWDEQNRLPFIL